MLNYFFPLIESKCNPHLLKNASSAAGSAPVTESSGM